MIDHSVIHIEDLKSSTSKGFDFSPNGKRLAVIVSDNGQDTVEIYKTKDWKLSRVSIFCETFKICILNSMLQIIYKNAYSFKKSA